MDHVWFLGVRFDRSSLDEAIAAVSAPPDEAFRYVVTPNADHLVRIHESRDPEIAAAYEAADFSFCDSQVLRFLALPFGIHLNTVTGSDLVLKLIPASLKPTDRLNLLGGDEALAALLRTMLPGTRIATHFPPMGMLRDTMAMDAAVAFLEASPADYTLLCCGSPQQEIVAYRARNRGRARGTALCIGAAVEFLVGRKRRASVMLRRMGLEWLHRLLSEPRRLWMRYLVRSPKILAIVVRWQFMRQVRRK